MDTVENFQDFTYSGRGIFHDNVRDISVGDITQDYVFNAIKKLGPVTRGELKEKTTVPRTTLYDTIVKLIIARKVEKFSVSNKKRGRPKVFYKIL